MKHHHQYYEPIFTFFNRWLSQLGPDQVIEVLADFIDVGAVFAVDTNNKILFWSKSAEKLFGLRAESVMGKTCTEALDFANDHDPCELTEQGALDLTRQQLRDWNFPAALSSRVTPTIRRIQPAQHSDSLDD